MPLMEPDPPSTRPRGQWTLRPPNPASGSVAKRQSYLPLWNSRAYPAGMWIQGSPSPGPASSSVTRTEGSSDSRAATMHPADPPPTTI